LHDGHASCPHTGKKTTWRHHTLSRALQHPARRPRHGSPQTAKMLAIGACCSRRASPQLHSTRPTRRGMKPSQVSAVCTAAEGAARLAADIARISTMQRGGDTPAQPAPQPKGKTSSPLQLTHLTRRPSNKVLQCCATRDPAAPARRGRARSLTAQQRAAARPACRAAAPPPPSPRPCPGTARRPAPPLNMARPSSEPAPSLTGNAHAAHATTAHG